MSPSPEEAAPVKTETDQSNTEKVGHKKIPQVGMARLVSLLTILAAIILLGMTFIRVLTPFLLPLFLAGVVAIICQPMFRYFLRRTKQKRSLAAGLTTASIVAIIIIPLLTTITIGGLQLYSVINNELSTRTWTKTLESFKDNIGFRQIAIRLHKIAPLEAIPEELTKEQTEGKEGEELEKEIELKKKEALEKAIGRREEQLRNGLQQGLTKILRQTFSPETAMGTFGLVGQFGSVMMACAIFVFALFYFLADGTQLIEASENLIPVKVQHLRELLKEFAVVVRAVVMATMLAALGQGLAVSIILYLLGFGHFFIYSIVAILCALIPFVGTTIVWIPCCIWLITQGSYVYAICLALWGSIIVGTLDNVIRAYILNSDAKLHPLLAFVAILGGLQVMGLWGVFIAPIIASCLHALIKIFNSELYEMSLSAVQSENESMNSQIEFKEKEKESKTLETKSKPTDKKT